MEIYRIEIDGTEKVFECELTGAIETVESDLQGSTDQKI